jgi:hypothetical protein
MRLRLCERSGSTGESARDCKRRRAGHVWRVESFEWKVASWFDAHFSEPFAVLFRQHQPRSVAAGRASDFISIAS